MKFAGMGSFRNKKYHSLLLLLVIPTCFVAAQEKKTARDRLAEAKEKAINSIMVSARDTSLEQKSEAIFLEYEGKIIRDIYIDQIGFDRSMYDTASRKVFDRAARLANSLHSNTRKQTIRNNLFIQSGKPLNPYKVADNERYLRDLDFILDARIVIQPANGSLDSVDVFVITRDVFSLGGSFRPTSLDEYRMGLFDANLAGLGQRVQINSFYDSDRDPKMGYQFLYRINSLFGSLVNSTVSYTQIDNGASMGLENENAFFVRLDRPLVSPYTRMAGGFEFSRNWSSNVYAIPDTVFRRYNYHIQDVWVGYNIGIKKGMNNRNRHFLSFRIFNQHFLKTPEQVVEKRNPLYNDKTYVLGSITFFNQNFYKTRYVLGFGRTEDVPYGRSLSLTAGRVTQLDFVRGYLGMEWDKTIFRKNGDFHEFKLEAEGYYRNNSFEDVTVLASASLFSRLLRAGRMQVRQSFNLSYTGIFNQQINLPLSINSPFGLEGFRADSVLGVQRLSLRTQTVAFTSFSLAGFRFAPIFFAEMSLVSPTDRDLFHEKPFYTIGTGVRTRNENLVFGTIELKVYYFPRVTEDLSSFKISLTSNLRVKYSAGFVKAPAFIQYN